MSPLRPRFYGQTLRTLFGTLDRRLGESEYLAGDDYTVADIATYPDAHLHGKEGIGLGEYPNVERWHDTIAARPAVQKAWVPFEGQGA